jgi:hypothetical protein
MRVVVVCLVLTGCDYLFNLDPIHSGPGDSGAASDSDGAGNEIDAPVDAQTVFPTCAGWGNRQDLQGGATGSHDPTLSKNRLELFTVRMPSTSYDIYLSRRPDTMSQFDIGSPVGELNSPADDTDPALTADGLMIVFISTRGGSPRVYQATRPAVGIEFSPPDIAPGLLSQPADGIDLSPDGLSIYIHSSGLLLQATRANRGDAFGARTQIASFGSFPSMAPDGLAIYFNGASGGLVRRTRAVITDGFSAMDETVDGGASDGDMLADGTAVVMSVGSPSDITVIRECQ